MYSDGVNGMTRNVLKDEKGVVLILVLIILVAAIIIGVTVIKSSVLEARIAGNEQRLVISLNNLETGIDLFSIESTQGIIFVGDTPDPDIVYDFANPNLPASTSVTVRLESVGKPPVGSGYDPSFKARYYEIQTTDDIANQTVTAGVYKVFPPAALQ
jgi:hypothetical protein